MTDKKITRIFSVSNLAALLLVLLIPIGESGRIAAAIILLFASVLVPIFVKKRSILSINKNQVLLIMTVIALVYVMVYYLTGIEFGFYSNPYRLTVNNFLTFALPIAVIVISSEIVRSRLLMQSDRLTEVLCYFITVISEVLIYSSLYSATTFSRFVDLVVGAFFPALLSNLLYNYLSKRYGVYPVLSYRLISTLHAYLFQVRPGIAESIVSFFKLILPIIIYVFIDALYEKKKRYALGNNSRIARAVSRIFAVITLVVMISTVMLVSNQFSYGSLVIATESMTGELNKGDVVIFESYTDQSLDEGQVIIYKKNNSMVVHRVVDIQIINGIARYYTKGDANEDNDLGFITDTDIVGIVSGKLPIVGYPTLWFRSLFKR